MTSWNPPLETGWQGDRYIEDDLGLFYDDLSDAQNPGVYAVKLSTPDDWDVVIERWDEHFDPDAPDWLREAFESHVVVYVGAAKNVSERLHTHLQNPNNSTAIARVFPLHSLWDVWPFDSADEAFTRESGIALDLSATYPGMYVRQQ